MNIQIFSDRKTLIVLTLFSIAMGYLETAVVVDLRELYFPGGFRFPLAVIPTRMAITEFWREVATMVMLVTVGMLAGKNRTQRFVYFLYSFAIWDIFYYVFLYVLLGWPQSFFTWDILFLIPVPWVGPVLAPCLVACTMIVYCALVVTAQRKGKRGVLNLNESLLMAAGAVLILVSFMWDYFVFVHAHPELGGTWSLSSSHELFSEIKTYIPKRYNWPMFLTGQAFMLISLGVFARRMEIFKPQPRIIETWKDSVS